MSQLQSGDKLVRKISSIQKSCKIVKPFSFKMLCFLKTKNYVISLHDRVGTRECMTVRQIATADPSSPAQRALGGTDRSHVSVTFKCPKYYCYIFVQFNTVQTVKVKKSRIGIEILRLLSL